MAVPCFAVPIGDILGSTKAFLEPGLDAGEPFLEAVCGASPLAALAMHAAQGRSQQEPQSVMHDQTHQIPESRSETHL